MNPLPAMIAALALPFVISTAHAHSVPLNKEAMAACKEKTRSQACEYQGHHKDLYIGSCQYVSDEDLICVRNKPIQKIRADEAEPASGHREK